MGVEGAGEDTGRPTGEAKREAVKMGHAEVVVLFAPTHSRLFVCVRSVACRNVAAA